MPIQIVSMTSDHREALYKFGCGLGKRHNAFPVNDFPLNIVNRENTRNTDNYVKINGLLLPENLSTSQPANRVGTSDLNFVALNQNQIVGYVVGRYNILDDFGVENTRRRNEIALALLERFAATLRSKKITNLKMEGGYDRKYAVSDLGSLKMFSYVTNLYIQPRANDNWRSLADLPQLTHLTIDNSLSLSNSICNDFQFLSSLTQLEHLELIGMPLSNNDLGIISNLPQLNHLNIGDVRGAECSQITNLSPLAKLENLKSLYFHINRSIQDFAPIGKISRLRLLHFNDMKENFADLRFLQSLPHLNDLSIIASNFSPRKSSLNFEQISPLTNLTRLDLSNNNICDISFLLPLSELRYLNLKGNRIQDFSPIDTLKKYGLKEAIIRDPNDRLSGVYPGATDN